MTIVGKSYSSAEIQSVYSTAPADWHVRHSLRDFYPSTEILSVYSAAPADWATRQSLGSLTPLQISRQCVLLPLPIGPQDNRWEFLPLCRYPGSVFYCLCRLGHRTIVGKSYPFAEIQSVYSTAPPTRWGSLTTLQRCSRCILLPQPTGPNVAFFAVHIHISKTRTIDQENWNKIITSCLIIN